MHASSIVPWIWAIVIGIGIINSIRKKAAAGGAGPDAAADARAAEAELRKQAYLAMVARQRAAIPPPQPVPVARETGAAARAAAPVIPAAAARPSAPAQVAAPLAPAPPSAPASPVPHPSLASRRSGAFHGMFRSKKSILRAMVAAEVLGRPKALADQPYWSSRTGGG